MATSLDKLVVLREQLEAKIEELKQKNRVDVIEAVRAVIAEYAISELELAGRKRGPRSDKGVPRGPAAKKAKAKAKPAAKASKPQRTRRKFTDAQKAKIAAQALALREKGDSWSKVTDTLGVAEPLVRKWIADHAPQSKAA